MAEPNVDRTGLRPGSQHHGAELSRDAPTYGLVSCRELVADLDDPAGYLVDDLEALVKATAVAKPSCAGRVPDQRDEPGGWLSPGSPRRRAAVSTGQKVKPIRR
jgi:hypothetical protein